jgi:hypothetical protein
MRFFYKGKDGGSESTVWGYWLIEIKSLFSIVLLRFENGTRDAYHEHAFHCFSWVIRGELLEHHREPLRRKVMYLPSWRPFITRRQDFHKVESLGRTWVLSFRGPWTATWAESTPENPVSILTHGRRAA